MATHFDISLDESVQVLKRVLPLMSQQRVPTIPENYAVWFEYVMNQNQRLRSELETVMDGHGDFTKEFCRRMYEKYFLEDLHAEVDGIQDAMREAMNAVVQELSELGDDFGHFSEVLDDCGEALKGSPMQSDLQNIIVELARETRTAKNRSREVEGSLVAMADELADLRSQVNRLSRDSLTDALTGVANRRAFDEAMAKTTADIENGEGSLCLILADIDHFKVFNDTHGHLVGDTVLRFVAQELERCVKGRDLLARYGGEEFAALLPATQLNGATMLARNIRAIIEAQSLRDDYGNPIGKVTISLGVAQYRKGETISAFIERTDMCLYRSKETGRNRVTAETELESA